MQHSSTLAQPYWANHGQQTTNDDKKALIHSSTSEATSSGTLSTPNPYGASSIRSALLPAADISPRTKRARLAPSLPHRPSSDDSFVPPLPTTSASLPRHLQAFTHAAPRPRAHIIVADVHRMGRVAVHADVFAQIVEAEERVMGLGAARTRRARQKERTRSGPGNHRYSISVDSVVTTSSNNTSTEFNNGLSSNLGDITDISAPWPDAQYPWSFTTVQLADKRARSKHAELAHVERWLGAGEDELDGAEEPAWNTSGSALEDGLAGLDEIPGYPSAPIPPSLSGSAASDEDGADARTALLARASVQEFIARRTARAVVQHTASGDVVRCICRAGADGRPMIQCSDCRTWAHRICMDAPGAGSHWRCWRCAPAVAAPQSISQPTFVPNTTPGRRIAPRAPVPTHAVQWQPSPLLPAVPLPETPERTAPFPFHTFITPRFFTDFGRRDTDDEGDAEMADGSPSRQRIYSPVQSPQHTQLLQFNAPPHPEPSPSTPPPLRSNATTTPMTPERSAGPRPHPQHSGSTVADSTGPVSPAGAGGDSIYADTGSRGGFTGEVGVYAGEDSPVRQRRAHRAWQLGTGPTAKAQSDMGVWRGDGVTR